MVESRTQTSTTLLEQVAGGQPRAESEFCRRYGRMALAVALAAGVRQQDAEDIVQESMLAAVQALRERRYDRERGRFKPWFKGVLFHKIGHARRAIGRQSRLSHLSGSPSRNERDPFDLAAIPEPSPGPAETYEMVFEAEWQALALQEALDEIRCEVEPATWQAFDLTQQKNWPIKDAARLLGMRRGAVDQAIKRVRDRLRNKLAAIPSP